MEEEGIRKKAYIYPVTSKKKLGFHNPYVDNFIKSTGTFLNYLNKKFPSNTGIFNLIRFIHKIDFLLLNWIEDLPDKKGGVIQSIFFLIFLRFAKFFRIKIIWTLHNKFSHSSKKLFLKRLLFLNLLKFSDLIITHSIEGINFAESLCSGVSQKIFYFQHPIIPVKENLTNNYEKKYDILIWGTLAPYKGIDVFLKFLYENGALNKYNILIAGKAVSSDFYNKLQKYENVNIIIKNQFIETEELAIIIQQSKVILFTYSGESVLSSGALIDSISYVAKVIGPNVGAFAELANAGIIKTYDSFNDLKILLEQINQWDDSFISERINDFINAHTWAEFSMAFEKRLKLI